MASSTEFRSASPAWSSTALPSAPSTCIRCGGGFPLQAELEKRWQKPVRVGNDADVAGYGAIKAMESSWCSLWAQAWERRSLPAATSAPAWSWATPLAQKGMTYEDYLGGGPGQVRQSALE